MAFDCGAITARITLDSSAFNTSMNQVRGNVAKAGEGMQKFGQNIMSATRQLSRVASSITFIGAGITAPLIMAFKSAEKYSQSVKVELDRLNNTFIKLRTSIAESLVPIMHRFSNILADFAERWEKLSPAMREAILRTTLLTGVFLTLGGTIANIAIKLGTLGGFAIRSLGQMMKFAALHPYLFAIQVAIGILIYMMLRYEEVGVKSLNAVEIGVNMVAIGWNKVIVAMANVLKWQARLFGNFSLANWFKQEIVNYEAVIKSLEGRIGTIIETGEGRMAQVYTDIRNQVEAIKSLFSGLGVNEKDVDYMTEAPEAWSKGWSEEIQKTISDLNNWGKTARSIVQQTASNMQSIFSNFFQGFLKGEIRNAKQLFVEFGNFVLKILSDVIAQVIAAQIMTGMMNAAGGLFGMFGGLFSGMGGVNTLTGSSYSIGGQTIASSAHIGGMGGSYLGMQEGTERIPYTGLYKLHSGEMVTPRYDANKNQKEPLNIYNLITSEAVASAMAGKEGENVVINIINRNSLRNGMVRKEIVRR